MEKQKDTQVEELTHLKKLKNEIEKKRFPSLQIFFSLLLPCPAPKMNHKLFYFTALFVILTSLLGFLTMYNDVNPNYLLIIASFATIFSGLYLISLLTSRNKKSGYQYAFALIGIVFGVMMMDYGNNGVPTHIGDLSLYTLKVLNSLILFFFCIIAFIVFGQLDEEQKGLSKNLVTESSKQILAGQTSVHVGEVDTKPINDNVETTHFEKSDSLLYNPSIDTSFSSAFNHGFSRQVTCSLFDFEN